MPVDVNVRTLPPKSAQHVRAEQKDHYADTEFQDRFRVLGNARAEQQQHAGYRQ